MVGWALDRSLAAQLAVTALQTGNRQPKAPPGARTPFRPGIQYASGEYGRVLDQHQIIASMSHLTNPWDNAKCESFMKTLKREEINANEYRGAGRSPPKIKAYGLQHARGSLKQHSLNRSSRGKRGG